VAVTFAAANAHFLTRVYLSALDITVVAGRANDDCLGACRLRGAFHPATEAFGAGELQLFAGVLSAAIEHALTAFAAITDGRAGGTGRGERNVAAADLAAHPTSHRRRLVRDPGGATCRHRFVRCRAGDATDGLLGFVRGRWHGFQPIVNEQRTAEGRKSRDDEQGPDQLQSVPR
jgi:hypothetical protein